MRKKHNFVLPSPKKNEQSINLKKRKYSHIQNYEFENPQLDMKWNQKEHLKMKEILLNQFLTEYKIEYPKEFRFQSKIEILNHDNTIIK